MKKKLLSIGFVWLTFCVVYSQSEYLYINGPLYAGVDVGYTSEGFIPIGLHIGHEKMQYGITFGFALDKGIKGEHYSTINWDQFPEDIVGNGSYYTPFSIDIGYNVFGSFVIGAGVGYAWETLYRNMFDKTHILGNNGSYYISAKGESKPELKGFASYYFPTDNMPSIYLKAHYSLVMGFGASIGFTF